jgi:hypothetical protein
VEHQTFVEVEINCAPLRTADHQTHAASGWTPAGNEVDPENRATG